MSQLSDAQELYIQTQRYLVRALEAEKECWDIVADTNRRLNKPRKAWWKFWKRGT